MLVQFAYSKLVRKNQSIYAPSTPATTFIQSENLELAPLGSTGAATAAPSTLIIDRQSGNVYSVNAAYSATYAALTAVSTSLAKVVLT